MISWLVPVVPLTAFTAVAVVGWKRDQRYRGRLRGWAQARGWAYREDGAGQWQGLLPKGDGHWGVRLQLGGICEGRLVTVADYWYRTTSHHASTSRAHHTTTTRHHMCVIVVQLATHCPPVALERRGLGLGWGLAVSGALGMTPANLTGTGDFDRQYRIRSQSPDGAVLVTPALVSAYLSGDLPAWQLSGDELVIAGKGLIPLDDLDRKVAQALTIARHLDQATPSP